MSVQNSTLDKQMPAFVLLSEKCLGDDGVMDWCSLSVEEKIVLVLGASDRPLEPERINLIIFLLDKIYNCREGGLK